MTLLYVVLGVVLLLALAVVVSYNRFVRQRNLVQESWRQIDVELTRRHELIPNLVETVKGYAAHERTVLASVVEARNQAVAAAGSVPAQAQLGETEDRIAAGRRFYNGNVRALNTRVEAFPSSLVASTFGFHKADYFETEDPAVRAPVVVDFSAPAQAGPPASESAPVPPASA